MLGVTKLCSIWNSLNLPGVAVLMPYDGTKGICLAYAVDVLQGQELPVKINTAELQALEWKPTHILGDPALFNRWKIGLEGCFALEMYAATPPR